MKGTTVRKAALDRRIAICLGLPRHEVSFVTTAFLEEIAAELIEMTTVRLDGLGELHLVPRKGSTANLRVGTFKKGESRPVTKVAKTKYHVSFKKAVPLKKAIQLRYQAKPPEKTMNKFGVDESQTENEKKASDGCPQCGGKVERHGKVLMCPKCGTEPWETKQE